MLNIDYDAHVFQLDYFYHHNEIELFFGGYYFDNHHIFFITDDYFKDYKFTKIISDLSSECTTHKTISVSDSICQICLIEKPCHKYCCASSVCPEYISLKSDVINKCLICRKAC